MESPEFTRENALPIPRTPTEKYQMIYICLKIYHKIINVTSFSLSGKDNYYYVDLEEELSFAKKNNLVKLDNQNEFKLGNPPEERYKIFEGWKLF